MRRITISRARTGHASSWRRGFTLMELRVVVVIIGLLAAFVAPRHFNQLEKSSAKIAKAQITSLEQAL